jgi:syntaxin 1B/2/3
MAYNNYGSNPYGTQQGGGAGGGHGATNGGPYGAQYGGPTASNGQLNGGTPSRYYEAQPPNGAGGGYNTGNYSNIVAPADQFGNTASRVPTSGITMPVAALSTSAFLARVEGLRHDLDTLTDYISQVATLHQRSISGGDDPATNASLESLVSRTQILNTSIKDQIKRLESDANASANNVKVAQINAVKNEFKRQLEEYRAEEIKYRKRYQDIIARQYKVVNPRATEAEAMEAATADWGDEGVFQTAVSIPLPSATIQTMIRC